MSNLKGLDIITVTYMKMLHIRFIAEKFRYSGDATEFFKQEIRGVI